MFTGRNMLSVPEVHDIAINWAADAGWNPGLQDAQCFYHADPQGFYVGLLDGQPISCIFIVHYADVFAFLGFYIVIFPRFQGHMFLIIKQPFRLV